MGFQVSRLLFTPTPHPPSRDGEERIFFSEDFIYVRALVLYPRREKNTAPFFLLETLETVTDSNECRAAPTFTERSMYIYIILRKLFHIQGINIRHFEQVRLCRAQNLKKVQMLGKQDPYVRAKLYYDGHQVRKGDALVLHFTQTRPRTGAPHEESAWIRGGPRAVRSICVLFPAMKGHDHSWRVLNLLV